MTPKFKIGDTVKVKPKLRWRTGRGTIISIVWNTTRLTYNYAVSFSNSLGCLFEDNIIKCRNRVSN